MANINLDDLFGTPDPKKAYKPTKEKEVNPITIQSSTPVTGEELGLVLTGSRTDSKGAKSVAPPANRSLSTLYQENQKLVYILDISISMNGMVVGEQQVSHFLWTDAAMQQIKENVEWGAKRREASIEVESYDPDDPDLVAPDPETIALANLYDADIDDKWVLLEGLDGEELKKAFLRHGLHNFMYLARDYNNPNANRSLNTKMELVKNMAKRMVTERAAKFPDASIEAIGFNTSPHALSARTADALVQSIAGLYPSGGTDITSAVQFAMRMCRKRPSNVNLHHFVLVTDGEDYGAMYLPDMIPEMKALGVVLDFIFIAHPGEKPEKNEPVQAIKKVCDALGGTFTIVTTAEEFETKFVEASVRALLPPPTK